MLPLVGFVVIFGFVPVAVYLIGAAMAPGAGATWSSVVADPLNREALENSITQGGASAAVALGLGYTVGIFLGRYAVPGREMARALLLVPFLLPSLVMVEGVRELFGPSGVAAPYVPLLAGPWGGWVGIIVVNVAFNTPMVVLFTAAGCDRSYVELDEGLATLGASPRRRYREVWGPPTWVGAAQGALLTFLFSAMGFAAPLLFGPQYFTLEARIYSLQVVYLEPQRAAALALIAVAFLAIPTVAYLALRRSSAPRGGRRPFRPVPLSARDPWVIGGAVGTAVLAALEGSIAFTVLYRSVTLPTGAWYAGWTTLFGPATTNALGGLSMVGATINTLWFAALAAAIAILLTFGGAFSLAGRPRASVLVHLYLFVPLLVSPLILALALAAFWRSVLTGPATVWVLIVVSQSMLGLPFALQSFEAPLVTLSAAPREAARTLGASAWSAFTDVDVPRIRSGLVTAGLFAFVIGLGEFTATNFLATPKFATISVAIYELPADRLPFAAETASAWLLIVSLAAIAALLLGGFRGRR